MALTQADKTELLNAIKAESQSVDELTQVTSLDGIVSLPAIRGTEVVSAPVSLLANLRRMRQRLQMPPLQERILRQPPLIRPPIRHPMQRNPQI